ncbi:hypothetical protein L3X38_044478 [Prunus dulcis]|uniref:Phototropin 2 n=1 Tax=Prunus dulcis TaxID=3755 RepID=A0AAD4V0V2_PRUDU|nr:hypothetical protein L3X38_044478 [Prunus dulcis]
MEKPKATRQPPKPSSVVSSIAKDQVGSGEKQTRKPMEVFHLRENTKKDNHADAAGIPEAESGSGSTSFTSAAARRDSINKWMAFEPGPSDEPNKVKATDSNGGFGSNSNNHIITEKASIAARTAEWGLVMKSDIGEGSFKRHRVKDIRRSLEEIADFFRGPETDQDEVAKIRDAVKNGTSYCGRLFNYKKDGTPFWNLLTITPIKDEQGKTIKFIGMQVEVSKYTEGVNEKELRPNGLPKSLIRYDARQKEKALGSIKEVVETVKHPRSHTQDVSHVTASNHGEQDSLNLDYVLPKSAAIANMNTPGLKNPQLDVKEDAFRMRSSYDAGKISRKSGFASSMGFKTRSLSSASMHEKEPIVEPEVLMTTDIESSDSWDRTERERDMRQGIDLATTLERIEKNFVISDPRIPDNPIIFASDSFLELTEYTREEILGRNCRFLQGPETDQATVSKIRDAIREQREITVQLINYTKSGKKFWNLFHLQPMRDQKGELQYFIGVQLDGSDHVEPLRNRLSERAELESSKLVKATAVNVDEAVRELPDANLRPEDLWAIHSRPVFPRPHKRDTPSWLAIQEITARGEKNWSLGNLSYNADHKYLFIWSSTCQLHEDGMFAVSHLVELQGTGELYAMKAMEKSIMLNRNKVHRACIEREIISLLDHPFLPTLYTSFQTSTHPMKLFKEDSARFYAAEVVIALEYLHCLGNLDYYQKEIVYRDLKPENIFTPGRMGILLRHQSPNKRRRSRSQPPPTFVAEPVTQSNSFVGTEEYIAPEIITGAGPSSAIDWWALGILLYEMLYGRTPFRGKNRQRTFTNVLVQRSHLSRQQSGKPSSAAVDQCIVAKETLTHD